MKTAHYSKSGKSHYITIGLNGTIKVSSDKEIFNSKKEATKWAKEQGLESWNY